MVERELTEVAIPLREVRYRDLDTDEEGTAWEIRLGDGSVIREDTPKEALEVLAASVGADNDKDVDIRQFDELDCE